jgi:hypothetical protein
MDEQDFVWMNQRFDRVDKDNKEIKAELVTVHDKVNRHDVYWSITKKLAVSLPASGAGAYILSLLGIGAHKN